MLAVSQCGMASKRLLTCCFILGWPSWLLVVFHFSIFFEFYAHIFESWSNPRFDQDLNKFKT
jgi:hypothetical protein